MIAMLNAGGAVGVTQGFSELRITKLQGVAKQFNGQGGSTVLMNYSKFICEHRNVW
jgi:hypothetical protein